jgi:biotin carboxyl carrier protein
LRSLFTSPFAMKFDIQLNRGADTSNCRLELRIGGTPMSSGQVDFSLGAPEQVTASTDGAGRVGSADWVEITPGVYSILIGGRSYQARVTSRLDASSREVPYVVALGSREYEVEVRDPRAWSRRVGSGVGEGPQEITAPMPGKVVKVLVTEGQQVSRGQGLVVIEAMKMQNELHAPRAGRVGRIYAAEGSGVEAGAKLLRLEGN